MSRFLTLSDSQTKKCAICQQRAPRTSYFRGRCICDDCLSYIKKNF